jgi:hypothetical protein
MRQTTGHVFHSWVIIALLPLVLTPPGNVIQGPEPSVVVARQLEPAEIARRDSIVRCLAIYYTRPVDAEALRPWSIMHGLIAYGQETKILYRGRLVGAVEHLCANGIGNDKRLMSAPNGHLHVGVGPGVQGHAGQFLAMLAQSGVSRDQPIFVDEKQFTVDDLIRYEQRDCRSGTELTFRLIGLSHYLDSNATWTNDLGEPWSIARLLQEELKQPINGAACGGTHRLMGLSYAVANRRKQGHEFDVLWQAAARFVDEFQDYALSMQNSDGSFSTEWFRSRATDKSAKRRLYTTGHVLEWLVYSLPDDRLDDPQITRAVDYVTNLMLGAPGYQLDVGPRGHSLHALLMYHQRVYGAAEYRQLLPRDWELTDHLVPARNVAQPARTGTFQTVPFGSDGRRGIFGRRR